MYLREENFRCGVHPKGNQAQPVLDHRKCERRQIKGEGFTYISIVGWMDRREKTRRATDRFFG